MTGRQYSDGDFIYRNGDPADGVYRVRTGQVRLDRTGVSGATASVALRAGEIFGDIGFLTGDDRDGDAMAVGEVSVDFLRRNEFLAGLSTRPDLVSPLIGGMFDLLDGAAAAGDFDPIVEKVSFGHANAGDGNGGDSGDDLLNNLPGGGASFGATVVVIPDSKRLQAIVGDEEITITADRLPFRVGRVAEGEGKGTYHDVDLALDDRRPFNLSRRHFSIEEEDGALIIRDFSSYHGTTVNGLTLGAKDGPATTPLQSGESRLVAGKPDSPFRFRIVVS